MLPSAQARSISTSRTRGPRLALQAAAASWRAKTIERLQAAGLGGYLLIWILRPVFEIAIAALVYSARPELLRYTVVAFAANAFLFNTIFYIGEILEGERMNGTLVGLFLAPCSRFSWLCGFAVVGFVETLAVAALALTFGRYAYGVRFDPNFPAILVSLALFLTSLWGLGMIFGAVGLLIKKANQLSNLIYPFTLLLGGVMYPVALLPDWLRLPSRALPLGYGIQALVDATLYHAGFGHLAAQLIPLAGFAVALPVAGVLAFSWLERLVRERGELDLY